LLGLPSSLLSGSGNIVERLSAGMRPGALAAAGRATAVPGAPRAEVPELVFPQLGAEPAPGGRPGARAAEAPPQRPGAPRPVAARGAQSPQVAYVAGAPAPAGVAPTSSAVAAPSPGAPGFQAPSAEWPASPASIEEAAVAAAAAPPEALSMRPGAVGAKAETFAILERLRSTGLALDFITPELYAAARTYGFNGADAARAAHLAEAGYPVLPPLAARTPTALLSPPYS